MFTVEIELQYADAKKPFVVNGVSIPYKLSAHICLDLPFVPFIGLDLQFEGEGTNDDGRYADVSVSRISWVVARSCFACEANLTSYHGGGEVESAKDTPENRRSALLSCGFNVSDELKA